MSLRDVVGWRFRITIRNGRITFCWRQSPLIELRVNCNACESACGR